jgi:WD40 repeat protein
MIIKNCTVNFFPIVDIKLVCSFPSSVSADSTLRVWDIEAGKCIGIKGHDSEFTKVAIVNEYIKASDFFTGGVVTMELKNFSLPSPDEIKQILKNVKNIR